MQPNWMNLFITLSAFQVESLLIFFAKKVFDIFQQITVNLTHFLITLNLKSSARDRDKNASKFPMTIANETRKSFVVGLNLLLVYAHAHAHVV